MQTIRIYVDTLQREIHLGGLARCSNRTREFVKSPRERNERLCIPSPSKTLRENIRNAGNLRERDGTNENDWVCECVKQCIALYFFTSLRVFRAEKRAPISLPQWGYNSNIRDFLSHQTFRDDSNLHAGKFRTCWVSERYFLTILIEYAFLFDSSTIYLFYTL